MRRFVLCLGCFLTIFAGCSRIREMADPPSAKYYREYREAAVKAEDEQAPAMGLPDSSLISFNLEVSKVRKEKGLEMIDATETTRWLPENAAGANFATVVTRDLYAEVEEVDGQWQVTHEEVVSEDINTYEDRKQGL